MPKVGEIFIDIFANNNRLRGSLAQASSLIRDWSLVVTGLTQGITNAFRTIASVGIKAVVIALTTLTTAFIITAKSGADFQDNIVRAFVIMRESSGATKESLVALTKEAIRLGSETLFSATQAAIGLQTLARAGFTTQQAIAAIGPVLDLAIVGNIELAEASNIATASMFGFGLEATDMTKVVDVLSLASSQANTTISLLGSALGFVAPVAFSAGLSIEETASAIGVLSNAGIRGSRAGTTLRRALSILLAPTGRAKKIFDELGLTFNNTEGGLISFTEIIAKLNKANLTAAETQTIFGRIAGPGMAALLRQGSGALSNLTNKLEGAQGAADRMSQSFRTTVKGRVRDLGASIINLGLAFSEKFNKPLADTIFAVRNYVKEITEALQSTGIFKAVVEGTISAISPLTDRIALLATRFKEFLLGLTPEDITSFFETIRIRIDEFIKKLIENTDAIVSFFKGAIAIIKGFLNPVIFLVKVFNGFSDSTKRVVGFLLGLTSTLLLLTGGLIPIISLYVLFNLFVTKNAIIAIKAAVANMTLAGSNTAVAATAKTATGAMAGFTASAKGLFLILSKLALVVSGLVSVFLLAAAAGRGFAKVFETKNITKFAEGFEEGVDMIKGIFENLPSLFGKNLEDMKTQVDTADMFGSLPKQLQDALKKVGISTIGKEKAEEFREKFKGVTFRGEGGKARLADIKKRFGKDFNLGGDLLKARNISQGIDTPEGRANVAFQQARRDFSGSARLKKFIELEQQFNITANEAEEAARILRESRQPRNSFLGADTPSRVMAGMGIFPIDPFIGPKERQPSALNPELLSLKTEDVFRGVTGESTIRGMTNRQATLEALRDSTIQLSEGITDSAAISERETQLLSEINQRILKIKEDVRISNAKRRAKNPVKTGEDDRSTTSNLGNSIGVPPRSTN